MNKEDKKKLVDGLGENESIQIVTGYRVNFKMPEQNTSILLSVEAGQEAIKQWSEDRPTLLLKGACYSTKIIGSINPRISHHGGNHFDSIAIRAFMEGDAVLLHEANEGLQKTLGGADSVKLDAGDKKLT